MCWRVVRAHAAGSVSESLPRAQRNLGILRVPVRGQRASDSRRKSRSRFESALPVVVSGLLQMPKRCGVYRDLTRQMSRASWRHNDGTVSRQLH